jgi:hypothetical protein
MLGGTILHLGRQPREARVPTLRGPTPVQLGREPRAHVPKLGELVLRLVQMGR